MFEKLFGISDIQNLFETLGNAANQKASAATETAKVAVEQKTKIADSAAQYNDVAQQSLERLKTIESQGSEARRLASSDNIFDRVALIGEQILNPRDYTREGRMNQVSEIGQDLAARGQIHNIETNAAVARMDQAQAQEVLATAGVDAQMSSLRAKVDGIQLMNGMIQQTEILRMNNLTQQELPTLQKTALGPVPPSGKITIGGFDYAPAELIQRTQELETREKLSLLPPQATRPDYAQALRVHHDLQLATFQLPELETLKQNNYVMPDGTQVDPQLWDSHWSRQNQMQQNVLQTQLNQAMLGSAGVDQMIVESQQMATSIGKFATPGTPLSIARQNFLVAANQVAKLAESDTTPNGKMVQVQALQTAQAGMLKAVEQEAFRKAGGDKELATIYRSQMIGEQLQPAMVEDFMKGRYVKGKGFGDFLPSEDASRIRKMADEEYANLKKQEAVGGDFGSTKSDKELREEAVSRALEKQQQNYGAVGVNTVQQATPNRKDHPAIISGMTPLQIRENMVRATTAAWKNVANTEGLTEQQMYLLQQGKWQEAGITAERNNAIAERVNFEAVAQEYDMFDQQKPGLGYEVQAWFQKTLPEMARNYTAGQDNMTQVLAGDSVLHSAQSLADMYTKADEVATRRGEEKATYHAVGARRPENMWPVLLANGSRLSDSQRSTIYYDIIEPAIKKARAMGANDEVTTKSVFDALVNFKSEDGVTMAALKTFTRDMPEEIDRFDRIWRTTVKSQLFLSNKNNYEDYTQRLKEELPWLNRAD